MALGFIGAAFSAIGGNLKDQWKDAIMCEDMPNNVLMMRKTSKTGVISHGSSIIVNPGQIAVIISGGRVVDATAQEGVYRYEEGAPSFFAGDFGASFKDMVVEDLLKILFTISMLQRLWTMASELQHQLCIETGSTQL